MEKTEGNPRLDYMAGKPDARRLDSGSAPRRNTEGGIQPADKSLITVADRQGDPTTPDLPRTSLTRRRGRRRGGRRPNWRGAVGPPGGRARGPAPRRQP